MSELKKHIAFLLGAGFSVPAGMPTANELNDRILSRIYNKVRWSSMKQMVYDDYFRGFVLEKILIDYDSCYVTFNYEQFYDFIVEEKNKELNEDRLLSFIERGMYGYLLKCSIEKVADKGDEYKRQIKEVFKNVKKTIITYENEIQNFVENEYQNIIAESFLKNTDKGKLTQFLPEYEGFKEILKHYVEQNYIIDIYTLNHDLVLESLLSHTELKDKVCNGFGGEDIISDKVVKRFDYNKYFDKPIRIYKLHGSIDEHKLFDQNQYLIIQIKNGYDGIFPYHQPTKRIYPLFLTGKKSKIEMYYDEPFRTLLYEFQKNIEHAETLIVIGYSGYDDGINEILERYYNWNDIRVVSPDAENHPFVKNRNAKHIKKGIEKIKLEDIQN